MKRTKSNKIPDLILTSDFHLRDNIPICRMDDFLKSQTIKLKFISDLQYKYNCPVLHGGDLWDNWKPSPFMITYAIKNLPKDFWTVYGNHDLPQHNLELAYKCGINTLVSSKQINLLPGIHWGESPEDFRQADRLSFKIKNRKILVWHVMTWVGQNPWPGCEDSPAEKLLERYPEYDVILTGHNHKSFVARKDNRLLINPGSITRQDADQEEFEPCVYLYYADTNDVKEVYLPIERGVVSREHIERKKERDNRIDAFVSRLDGDFEASISFEDNLQRLLETNNIRQNIKDIVNKAVEN